MRTRTPYSVYFNLWLHKEYYLPMINTVYGWTAGTVNVSVVAMGIQFIAITFSYIWGHSSLYAPGAVGAGT